MPTLSLTKTAANGLAHDASHVNTPFTEVETWANTTKLDYLNIQDNGLRVSGLRTHANVEGVRVKVRNATGSSIAANSLVYFSGTYSDGTNNYPTITKAVSTTAVGSTYFAQAVTSATIADGADGTAAIFMELSSQDTSSGTVGDLVYLDTTAGGWTRTRPTGGQYIQVVGTITVVHASTGRIVLSLGAVPEHLTGGSSGLGATFQTLTVQGASGAAADIYHFGDAGEDNADKWKISVADGGNMTWENYTSGSYAAKMTMTSAGVVSTAGAITSSGAVTGSTLVGTVSTAAQNSITSASSLATVGTITAGAWQSSTVVASAYLDADTAHLSTTQTFTGDKTFTGTVTVGVDDTGKDVKFFGASAGAYMEWDESADQLRLMGASADATTSTGKLLLATSLDDINANDVLGKIDFQAPHEATGTDATTIAASITAVAQATFTEAVNATDLIFSTGHSEAATEKFRFTSQGELGIGGANYGSDGQVLTSTGAGTAPAWEAAPAGGIASVAADTTPQLGGSLDVNSQSIVSVSNGNILVTPHGTGHAKVTGLQVLGDTAAGDDAAIGYEAADGLILTGQGSTNDVVIKNDADAIALRVATGTQFIAVGLDNAETPVSPLVVTGAKNSVTVPSTGGISIHDSTSMAIGVGGLLQFTGNYTGTSLTTAASIHAAKTNGTDSEYGFDLAFCNRTNGGSNTEKMRISSAGNVGIGTTSPAAKLHVAQSANAQTSRTYNSHASVTSEIAEIQTAKAAANDFRFLLCRDADAASVQFNLRGDGNGYAASGFQTGTGDYAEYFESADGTALEVGKAVVLDGDKIRIYNADTDSADNILGVTRPKADGKVAAVVGNTAWNHWTDKYLTDDWGVYIREDVTIWEWVEVIAVEKQDEVLYVEGDELPDGKSLGDVKTEAIIGVEEENTAVYERDQADDWTPPEGAVSSTQSVRKLNPEYSVEVDDETNYSPREDRDEWNMIGLLGQVQIKADEPTRPTWIKMKDISDAVQLWMIR